MSSSRIGVKKMVRFNVHGYSKDFVGQVLATDENGWHSVKLLDKHGHLEYITVNPALVIDEWERGSK